MKTTTTLSLALLLVSTLAWAVPPSVPYTGYLTDEEGAPKDGDFTMYFTLHDAANGGLVELTLAETAITSAGLAALARRADAAFCASGIPPCFGKKGARAGVAIRKENLIGARRTALRDIATQRARCNR